MNAVIDPAFDYQPLERWFEQQGRAPAGFQRECWAHYLTGRSGLVHAPTGSGKTLAAWGGPLLDAMHNKNTSTQGQIKALWITPLKALASDTRQALQNSADGIGLKWHIGLRTGDASNREKRLARQGRLDALVTTPESLSLLLSYPDNSELFDSLQCIIVDEWHELLASKRGVLLELALARLRRLRSSLRIWGLSATLGNLDQALQVLTGKDKNAVLIKGEISRPIVIETVLPEVGERFPWAGHLGLKQLPRVLNILMQARSSLIFTNTRAQAELWHQALNAVWPESIDTLALHHGSLDALLRHNVEDGLRSGTLRAVVATSSLDLGVDFPAVDQVLQIGSPKGLARLIQRAGRSRHQPGTACRIVCIPTNTLELVEFAAARKAIGDGHIEPRPAITLALDVLAQHLITIALGTGFQAGSMLTEVRSTHAFAQLSDSQWQSVLNFIVQGGQALAHYPDFRRVEISENLTYRMTDKRQALRHRLSIGTIVSDGSLNVRFMKGSSLGHIEESFLSRLRPGDRFQFAGRSLELVQLRDMTAYVRLSKTPNGSVPRWAGSRMPLSNQLANYVQLLIGTLSTDSQEMRAAMPVLQLQAKLSSLPGPNRIIAETLVARDGQQLFVYPYAGRQVHEGLAALIATRWSRIEKNTFSIAVNDYGLVIAPERKVELTEQQLALMLSTERLADDLQESLNLTELAKRQFREIGRVAGLLPPSLPGRAARSLRQLQASSGLLFDVLAQFDNDHILLAQAHREVLDNQLDITRLRDTLMSMATKQLILNQPRTLTPLSFLLWAERIRGSLSNEDWKIRVQRAAEKLESSNE